MALPQSLSSRCQVIWHSESSEPGGFICDDGVFLLTFIEGRTGSYVYLPVTDRLVELGEPCERTLESLIENMGEPRLDGGWRFPSLTHPHSISPTILSFNLSEQCNLRCTYCYYNGHYAGNRVHNSSRIQWDEIKDSVDSIFFRGTQPQAVYFFGGEPLLNKKALYGIADFVRACSPHTQLQIATNGLLIDDSLIAFCEANSIYMNISYDGPSHDRFRIYRNGNGSEARVREIVQAIAAEKPSYFRDYVGLSAVVPYQTSLPDLIAFYEGFPAARQALYLDFDLILPDQDISDVDRGLYLALIDALWDRLIEVWDREDDDLERRIVLGFNCIHKPLWRAAIRRATRPEPDGTLHTFLGAERAPAFNVMLVRADGSINAHYEFQSEAYAIGNIRSGLDRHRVEDLSRLFETVAQDAGCRTCWAAPLCSIDFNELDIASSVNNPSGFGRKMVARCGYERTSLSRAIAALQRLAELHGETAVTSRVLDEARIVEARSNRHDDTV